jgi:16S rRNA (guanine1207-N2)-methyltransferase
MTGQYFEEQPTAGSRPRTIELVLPDLTMELAVDSAVFSSRAVDPGTLELLRATRPGEGAGVLLDLGCGYGPIACALARRSPQAQVWAVDINERALGLTRANVDAHQLANVNVARPEEVPAGLAFTGIWSNPPIRVGKEALHDLLSAWIPRLAPAGTAWLVVQRHLGSDSLAAWMRTRGWDVSRFGSKRGYRILRVMVPAREQCP